MMSVGAEGVVSVISNVMPAEMVKLVKLASEMNFKEASALHAKMYPLMKDLFIESNPIPVKALAAELGICGNDLRLPMVEISAENKKILLDSARKAGLSV